MTDDVRQLVAYRLNQSEETLEAARDLLKQNHLRDSINRSYYAMFYAGLGLLATRMLGSSKHSGVLSLFGQHFFKTGVFSADCSKYLREAFDMRQKCDYREFFEPDEEQARDLITHAEAFVAEAGRVWSHLQNELP